MLQRLRKRRSRAATGQCKSAVLGPANTLRPSIEQHSMPPSTGEWWHIPILSPRWFMPSPLEGRTSAQAKLEGLGAVFVPYAKPGLPLTREILACATPPKHAFSFWKITG